MRHLMLILQYRGTNYCGFQVQPNGVSVAQVVQDAIETVQAALAGQGLFPHRCRCAREPLCAGFFYRCTNPL